MSAPAELAAVKAKLALELARFDYRLNAAERQARGLLIEASRAYCDANQRYKAVGEIFFERRDALTADAKAAANDN